jgi:hypothetical protein
MPNGAAGSRPQHGGRPAKHTWREILNGICYAIRSEGGLDCECFLNRITEKFNDVTNSD